MKNKIMLDLTLDEASVILDAWKRFGADVPYEFFIKNVLLRYGRGQLLERAKGPVVAPTGSKSDG